MVTRRGVSAAVIVTSSPSSVIGSMSFASSIVIGPATAVAAPRIGESPVKTSSTFRSAWPLMRARLLTAMVDAPNCRSYDASVLNIAT